VGVATGGGHPKGVHLQVVIQSRRFLQAWSGTQTTAVASTGDAIILVSPWTRTHMLRKRPMCNLTIMALDRWLCVAMYGGHPQGVPLRVVIQSRRFLPASLETQTISAASTGDAIILVSPWTRTHMLRKRPTCDATTMAQAYDPQGRPLWSPPVSAAHHP